MRRVLPLGPAGPGSTDQTASDSAVGAFSSAFPIPQSSGYAFSFGLFLLEAVRAFWPGSSRREGDRGAFHGLRLIALGL